MLTYHLHLKEWLLAVAGRFLLEDMQATGWEDAPPRLDEVLGKVAVGIGKLDYLIAERPFSQQRSQKEAHILVQRLWERVLHHTGLLENRGIERMQVNRLLRPQDGASLQDDIVADRYLCNCLPRD